VTLASGTIGQIFGADPAGGLASRPLFEKSMWDSERTRDQTPHNSLCDNSAAGAHAASWTLGPRGCNDDAGKWRARRSPVSAAVPDGTLLRSPDKR